ncbi:Uncharacterized protein QTN25_008139 [Entamoeba marina]
MNSMSVFLPCDHSLYVVESNPNIDYGVTIGQSPANLSFVVQSPSPSSIKQVTSPKHRVSRTKKRWTLQLKMEAVTKAKEIGLTKATRYLQNAYPESYGELSPSTLQYWIQKFN